MKEEKVNIQRLIRSEFSKIKTESDLLQLINSIHKQLHNDYYAARGKQVPLIKLATLKYYKNYKTSLNKRYRTFTIKKKSGKDRIISAPAIGLKLIQQCLNEIFQTYYEANNNACGFIPERNITYGAKLHINRPYILNIDLKDFFDSITFPRIKKILMIPPFNLKNDKEPLAYIIACLCCHPKEVANINKNEDGDLIIKQVLPQGAPTSPILTNIVCRNLDRHLLGLAKRFKANYSRYADDITFSCKKNIFKSDSEFMIELKRIIEDEQGLTINPEKTRVQSKHQRQEVTGLVVNNKVNVSKRYIKQIRLWLHYWEKFGTEKAQQFFLGQYIRQRGNVKSHKSRIENVLGGKLDYMCMVVGSNNYTYKQLKQRYDKLLNDSTKNHIEGQNKHIDDDRNIKRHKMSQNIAKDSLTSLLDELIVEMQ